MSVIIEENLLAKSIGETIQDSLGSLSRNFLERSYTLKVSGGLLIQLVSDWVKLMKDIMEESAYQQLSSDLGFEGQKHFLTNVSTIILEFFDRYSEFCGEDFQIELEKFQILFDALTNLIEGFEAINTSQENSEAIQFLEQMYEGIDLVVDVIESHASNLPINILSVMKVIFIELPVKAKAILANYSAPENRDQKLARKYNRQIDRALNSGISKINDTLNIRQNQIRVKSDKELLEAQMESNVVPMQLIEFWLREDQQRVLSKEEEQETQLLMTIIDSHRNRKLLQ